MAHYLGQLLQIDTPLFAIGLKKLEQATSNRGIDTKLIGDIHEKAYTVLRKLGLDPANTTNKELWLALHGAQGKAATGGSDYVGLVTVDGVVSFNPNDIRRNQHRAFGERTTDAMRQALVHELTRRYTATGMVSGADVAAMMNECGVQSLTFQNKQEGSKK